MTLPTALHSKSQIRQLEAAAIAAGTPGPVLMQRAGAAAYSLLRQRWPDAGRLVVVAGAGNNGGDGFVVARLALRAGMSVQVMLVGKAVALSGEAFEAHGELCRAGGEIQPFDAVSLSRADVIVDALLGIGVRAPLHAHLLEAITAINDCGRPVLALDLPSGLDPDTGLALPAVRAAATLTFIALKQGLYLGDGPGHCGELHLETLELSPHEQPALRRLTDEVLENCIHPRSRQSHKSQFGRVVIVGGGAGMPGAVRLAGEAALHVGAGLVTVASLPEHLAAVVGPRPELMFRALRSAADVPEALEHADVIVLGPGLGRSEWARDVLDAVFAARQPSQRMVVDADALNLVSAGTGLQHCADWVLTPHPGEAARLLGVSTQDIQLDRMAALRALCNKRGGTIVLKGAGTLVGYGGEAQWLCERGNPGMAVPGMGDVLTGAIAGLLAQHDAPHVVVPAAVHAHALAGDRCARHGIRGVLALDVARELRAVLAMLP